MERPALQQLLAEIQAGRVDIVVVYKVDRLTRSLADFAKIVEILDARGVSFVSVTQQFNATRPHKRGVGGGAGARRSAIRFGTAGSSSSITRRKPCATSSAV